MISCCFWACSLLKCSTTFFASLPWLLWALMASIRFVVRPSWRKKMRCPTPQRGSGTEFVGAGATLGDAVGEPFAHVVDEKVREKIRRLIGKRNARAGRGAARNPCACFERRRMAVGLSCKGGASLLPGRCGGSGVGGASIRIKLANASMSERTAGFESPVVMWAGVKLSVSSGVAL